MEWKVSLCALYSPYYSSLPSSPFLISAQPSSILHFRNFQSHLLPLLRLIIILDPALSSSYLHTLYVALKLIYCSLPILLIIPSPLVLLFLYSWPLCPSLSFTTPCFTATSFWRHWYNVLQCPVLFLTFLILCTPPHSLSTHWFISTTHSSYVFVYSTLPACPLSHHPPPLLLISFPDSNHMLAIFWENITV